MIPIIASLLLFSACFGEESLSPEAELNSVLTESQKENLNKQKMWYVDQINWQGSKVLTKAELSKAINLKSGDKIHSSVFSQRLEDIELSKYHLKDLFAEKGLLLGEVRIEQFDFRDSLVSFTISVTEKEASSLKIGKITWEGNTLFSEKELNDALNLKEGDTFDKELLDQRLHWDGKGTDVSSLYINKGYAYFKIQVDMMNKGYFIINELPKGNHVIDLHFRLFEGVEVSIANINISGNKTISTTELMEKINIKEGDLFNRSKIIAAQKALVEMGKFDPEQIGINTPILQQNNQLMNIEFSVVELEK